MIDPQSDCSIYFLLSETYLSFGRKVQVGYWIQVEKPTPMQQPVNNQQKKKIRNKNKKETHKQEQKISNAKAHRQ